ncbi:hypothetical protein GH714_035782 [Hevea brasiliensis]|uniref:Peptidase M16 middle/third domain-containing protein n=1 Tax=Hevea brasiliensis TaxID=3981 RepID=A0A6A6KMZ9_HEVBR|nr:hypothetical protein GH714_035782 [Hevea brasiliensis]
MAVGRGEHMLFYASEKYPLEDSYSKYITEHGGCTNAYTSSEHTNYHFDVNTDCFEDALDRFAQFFIKPLMSADATTREIKAVDSENQKNLLSDAWRMNQVSTAALANLPLAILYLRVDFTAIDWGIRRILCGIYVMSFNLALELGYSGSSTKSKRIDTRQELIKFYDENYSANLMHLVIYSKESLDKIQSLVEDKFQEIRNNDRSFLSFPGQPCIRTFTEHVQDIVGLLFKYIRLLQQSGVSKWIFDENLLGIKEFEGQTDKVEPWYGTAYTVEKITSSMIQEWMLSAPNDKLHLPAPNVFIPTDLSLKDAQEKVAGLYYGIINTDSGFQVTVVGYNHKLRILLETVIKKIAKFEVKPDRFSVIKEMVIKEYENFKFQQPYQQAMYHCSLILQNQAWPWMDELEVLPHLEAEDLAKFVPLMLSRAFLECYIAGNIERSEAESIIEHMEDVFYKGPIPICQPLFPSQHLTNRVIKLERGNNYFYPIEGLNPSDENSALVHYIQVHRDDFMLNVKLQLFAFIAKQPAFHQLRSVEQLGYITVLMSRNDSGVRGGPRRVDLRVEAFLKMFETKLYEMTNEEFKNNVNALIDMKLEKHKNLREESGFYWREIYDGTLKFDRKDSEVAALRQLEQREFVGFFNEHIKVGAPQKRTLSVRVYGSPHSSEYAIDNSESVASNSVAIDDIFSFRRSQPLYGSFKGGLGHMKL